MKPPEMPSGDMNPGHVHPERFVNALGRFSEHITPAAYCVEDAQNLACANDDALNRKKREVRPLEPTVSD